MGGPAEAVFTLRKGMTKGRKGKLVASCSREWNSSMVTVEFWGEDRKTVRKVTSMGSNGGRTRRSRRRRTHHQCQDQAADAVPDLGGDVVAKLLQRCQEALELAELASAAGGRQLLVG